MRDSSVLFDFSVPGSRRKQPLDCLPELMQAVDGHPQVLSKMLAQELSQTQINQASFMDHGRNILQYGFYFVKAKR